jgi:hypothetical protein
MLYQLVLREGHASPVIERPGSLATDRDLQPDDVFPYDGVDWCVLLRSVPSRGQKDTDALLLCERTQPSVS